MKAILTKMKDKTVQELDVAIFHYLSEEKLVSIQLRGGLLKVTPEKTFYNIDLKNDDGTAVDSFELALFRAYNYTVDDANVVGLDGVEIETAPIVNNSISFVLA